MFFKKYLKWTLPLALFSLFIWLIPFSNFKQYPSSPASHQKTKISIIINPISGGSDKEKLLKEMQMALDPALFQTEILYTKAPRHATELAREAVKNKVDVVVVVGGDGSINEVGEALIGSQTALAIIPTGSGNGIARHLQIPTQGTQAIEVLKKGNIQTIDTVTINNRHYLGVAGIGFDAEVSWDFANFGHRGFISYLLLVLKKFPGYRPQNYELIIDGKPLTKRAFLICFANTSQFGNGAYIAPHAKVDDGLLEVVIIKKFPLYITPQITHQLFHHSLNDSEYVETIHCREVSLPKKNLRAHIDGEPILFEESIHLKINPASLKVVVP